MSITVVISAQVSDFEFWKSKFDGLVDQRVAATPDCVNLDTIFCTIAEHKLLSLGRIEEAL